jgi:pentapeptide repeat protein
MCTLQEARSRLRAGEPVRFSRRTPDEQRTVPAEWIEEAVRESARVTIANAIIQGALNLRYARFPKEFSLLRCRVSGPADFSCATFEQNLILSETAFREGVDFSSASLCYAARLARCKFLFGPARFADIHVRGQFSAQGVSFRQNVKARFDRARFDGYAIFRGATFQADAVFDDALFGSDADFDRATFSKDASFNETKVKGTAHFRGAVFEGEADFTGILIDSDGDFSDAQFRSKHDRAIFEVARFGTDAEFTRATFGAEASFLCSRILGQAEFQGAAFEACANFNSTVIERDAFFRPEDPTDDDPKPASHVTFAGEADFAGVTIGGDADFGGAVFKDRASFKEAKISGRALFRDAQFLARSRAVGASTADDCVDFSGTKFEAAAEFGGAVFDKDALFNGSTFSGVANFSRRDAADASGTGTGARLRAVTLDYATFQANARLEDTIFQGPASFRECLFRVVEFSSTGKVGDEDQFQDRVDLRGCTYDRIQVGWRALLDNLPGASDSREYDRQPYVQMEKAFRTVGRDEEADGVYLERCRVERQRKKGPPKVVDVLWWGLANYGVRPYRLILFAILLISTGAFVFHLSGAVEPKPSDASGSQHSGQERGVSNCPSVLTLGDSARLSLREFLPVELPLLEDCQVSHGYFSDFAALLKVLGWIIVPVGVAALAGLLRRGAPASSGE